MHFAEALMPREEAIEAAQAHLRAFLDRHAAYFEKAPGAAPDPLSPLRDAIRAQDAWYFVPFARRDVALKPMVVRINGLTRAVVVADAA